MKLPNPQQHHPERYILAIILVVVLPEFAPKEPHTYPLPPPPSLVGRGGESEGKRQKLMGWDENSLAEWQREKKTTINNANKKQIQHAVFSPPDTELAPK